MCDIGVNLPTVASFLMLYSLRCGVIVICFWTFLRSLFVLSFFVLAILWMYMPDSEMKDSQPVEYNFFFVFVPYILMIVTESFIVVASLLLVMGIFCDNTVRVAEYLVCRFFAFLFEILNLTTLCFHHDYYIGWYLVFLMTIILEVYAFIVVYSYYVDMQLDEKECDDCEMVETYKKNNELCVNYVNLPERREPSVSNVSQETRDIEVSHTTRDTADTPNTRTTRDMSTTRDT